MYETKHLNVCKYINVTANIGIVFGYRFIYLSRYDYILSIIEININEIAGSVPISKFEVFVIYAYYDIIDGQ